MGRLHDSIATTTTTTSTRNGTAAASAIMAGTMVGFAMGIGFSTITAVGLYLWYYNTHTGSDVSKDRSIHQQSTSNKDTTTATSSSISFLSDMTAALWQQINAVAVSKIQTKCQPIFDTLSYPLNNLHFTHISLGHVPFRFDHITVSDTCRINPITKQKYIQIKFDMIWDGECDIQLKCALGPLGIKSIKLFGRIVIDCQPIIDSTTMIHAIQYSFVNTPTLYIVDFTGIAQIADLKSIKNTIQSSIVQSIEDMMVLPKRTVMRIHDDNISLVDIYQPPIGVTRITLLKGYGFDTKAHNTTNSLKSISNLFHDIPDIYCTIALGGNTTWTSSVIRNTYNPVWSNSNCDNYYTDCLVYDLDQIVTITCYDSNVDDGVIGLSTTTTLGIAKISISELLYHKVHAIPLQSYITDDSHNTTANTGTFTGTYIQVQCDLFPFVADLSYLQTPSISANNIIDDSKNNKGNVKNDTIAKSICGLLTIVISQAFDLPIAEQTSYVGDTSYIEITFGTTIEPLIAIATSNGIHPVYDCEFHLPITYQMMDDAQYKVEQLPSIILNVMDGLPPKNKTEQTMNQKYGSIEISFNTLLQSQDYIICGRKSLSSRHQNSKLDFLVSLRGVANETFQTSNDPDRPLKQQPVDTDGSTIHDTVSKLDSSQLIRVTIIKGWGYKVEQKKLQVDDVPDVYCTVQLGFNPTVWTTSTIKNNTEPIWNESHTFFVPNDVVLASITLRVNVYDSDTGKFDTDDELGHVNVPITKILLSPNQTYDCELLLHGKPTNSYISIQCEKVMP
jgi:hypothetical protein